MAKGGPGRYTSEPIFVPRSPDAEEADGYILCVMYDAATELSELMILDAASMAEEIAVVPLKNNTPTVSTAAIPHCKAPVPAS
jgi:carotenoid cleavage dioxygenase-like enzyme